MNSKLFQPSSNLYPIITIFLVSIIIPASYCADDEKFATCSRPFNCGRLHGIGYPFWGGDRPDYCGRREFEFLCPRDDYPHWPAYVDTEVQTFRVLTVNQSIPTMTIARTDIWDGICPNGSLITNTTFVDPGLRRRDLVLRGGTVNSLNIFYGCTSKIMAQVQVQSNITCLINGSLSGVFFADGAVSAVEGCNISISVPVLLTAYKELWDGKLTLQDALNQGFEVQPPAESNTDADVCLACKVSGGICGSDFPQSFVCFCQDKPYPLVCQLHDSIMSKSKVWNFRSTTSSILLFSSEEEAEGKAVPQASADLQRTARFQICGSASVFFFWCPRCDGATLRRIFRRLHQFLSSACYWCSGARSEIVVSR